MKVHTDIELLRFVIDDGMINLSSVQEAMDKKREHYISLHPYKIWQGSYSK